MGCHKSEAMKVTQKRKSPQTVASSKSSISKKACSATRIHGGSSQTKIWSLTQAMTTCFTNRQLTRPLCLHNRPRNSKGSRRGGLTFTRVSSTRDSTTNAPTSIWAFLSTTTTPGTTMKRVAKKPTQQVKPQFLTRATIWWTKTANTHNSRQATRAARWTSGTSNSRRQNSNWSTKLHLHTVRSQPRYLPRPTSNINRQVCQWHQLLTSRGCVSLPRTTWTRKCSLLQATVAAILWHSKSRWFARKLTPVYQAWKRSILPP